jgi:hypothetical protein
MQALHEFWELLSDISSIVGTITFIFLVIGVIFNWRAICLGLFTSLLRLGKGLAFRKIAVFSEDQILEELLLESKLFKKDNLVYINSSNMAKANKETIYLVHWKYFSDKLDTLLNMLSDNSKTLIIYAPQKEGPVDFNTIDNHPFAQSIIVANLKGRLLNDIFTCLMTTEFK